MVEEVDLLKLLEATSAIPAIIGNQIKILRIG